MICIAEYAYTAKVNEKIDVYSFGVVLLELATGRDAQSGNEHMSLAEWAWWHYKERKSIADALDNEIKKACYLEEDSCVPGHHLQLGLPWRRFCRFFAAAALPELLKGKRWEASLMLLLSSAVLHIFLATSRVGRYPRKMPTALFRIAPTHTVVSGIRKHDRNL